MLCGAISGGIYKSTLGVIPTCVGTCLGASLIGTLTIIISKMQK